MHPSFSAMLFSALMWAALPASAAAPPVDPNADIAKARDAWAADLNAKQLGPITGLYEKDAVFLKANGDRIAGKTAIRELYKQLMVTSIPNITLHSLSIGKSGELAYDSGTYDETLAPVAPPSIKRAIHGTYLIVFGHQPDGSWQILQHMWTEAPTTP